MNNKNFYTKNTLYLATCGVQINNIFKTLKTYIILPVCFSAMIASTTQNTKLNSSKVFIPDITESESQW